MRVICTALILLVAAPLAIAWERGAVGAAPLEPQEAQMTMPEVFSFDGQSVFVRQDWMSSKAKILVERGDDGTLQLLVPLPKDGVPDGLVAATLSWVAENRASIMGMLETVQLDAINDPEALRAGELVYLNKRLDGWLDDSGAFSAIRSRAARGPGSVSGGDPQGDQQFTESGAESGTNYTDDVHFGEGNCDQIAVCDSCRTYGCLDLNGWKVCTCIGNGNSCCVIG